MRKIIYIFARDFNHWTNQLIREAYRTSIRKLWGNGLSDQMVHYDGRATIWYRYEDDNSKLKNFMVKKKSSDPIFQNEMQQEYRKNIDDFRKLIRVDISKIKDDKDHLRKIKDTFNIFYPLYPLSIFVAGPWREDFLKNHPKDGQDIIMRLMESRHHSEGVLKENDLFMRRWLAPKLKANKIPENYVKLLSVNEIDNIINKNIFPERSSLDLRSKGYFFIDGKINPTNSLQEFLKSEDIIFEESAMKEDSVKGTVACRGGIISGRARIILNSEEAVGFKNGEILITTMTSPDYLPALQKSKAIVTDEGSLTCHVAIVARELNKPAIMGAKNATKIFKDGDMVEIDTDKGTVRKI